MDKFTVDLDQVLNDFEYSELTDQCTTAKNPIDTSNSVNQNNVTKHSINNVFHSLNEYLNTSIDVPNVDTIQNNVREVKTLDSSYSEISHVSDNNIQKEVKTHDIDDDDEHFLIKVNNEDCIENSSNKLGEELEKNVNVVTPEVENTEYPNVLIADNEATLKDELNTTESKKIIIHNEETQITENVTELVDISNKKDASVTHKGETLIELDIVIEPEIVSLKNEIDHISVTSDILEEKIVDQAMLKDNIEPEIENLKNEVDHSLKTSDILEEKMGDQEMLKDNAEPEVENLKNEGDHSLVTSDILEEQIVDQAIVEDEIVNKKQYEEEEETLKKGIKVIGFNTVTNIHDDEIDELLAELENDKDLIQKELDIDNEPIKNEEIGENQIKTKDENILQSKVTDKPTTTEEVKEETLKINETVFPKPVEDSNHKSKLEVVQTEETIELDPNEHIENSALKELENNLSEETVQKEKPEELMHEKNTEVVIQEYKDGIIVETDQIMDETVTKQELCDKDVFKEKKEMEGKEKKFERQDSASRPQHLSLKEEEESEKQREINLIGNPGSTPYNNVYITEEIHKQERDNESVSSTSSNTFSDTGSTASTASTEEIRDENDEINSKETRIEPPVENIECDTRELSDEGAGDRNVEETVESNRGEDRSSGEGNVATGSERQWLGKEAPLWIPDSDTTSCLHCDMKFTVLKRRHHCRACGLVLCSKCCHLRFKLEYLDAEARVCNKCHDILNRDTNSSSSSDLSPDHGSSPLRRPNPNNPLEYCSTISPLQQVGDATANPVPAVMVPVGVLKRKGSNKAKSNKSVMFCDGIRPGSDLTNLDNDFNYSNTKTKKLEKTSMTAGKINRHLPLIDSETNSFIPKSENSLPPLITITKTDVSYTDCPNNPATVESLKNDQLTFAILLSLYVHVKIINMSCCINKMAWCFSTEGLINVGQDEIVIVLEYIDEESFVPKDVFYHINSIYVDAVKGTSIKELGLSLHNSSNFLDSKNHAGFVYIRPTFQCLENVIKPKEPFLIGILIHRWETPWAKLFPLRLILRLGAEYRYYPSPVISTRHRDSVFVEIGHTIINLLADFRNFSYTLPQINGLTIHMEDKNTTVTIPANRYDMVVKSLNNSSDHILAFAGAFSQEADSYLVCIQDTQGNDNCYSTHAINIQSKPRKRTGASFIVFNGALKSTSGLTAKSNIVEDGLMIQVLPEHMQQIRDNLRAMKNHTISCGCVNADSDETVSIVWGENDVNFNIGVTSAIDSRPLNGVPSIRVHNGKNYCANGNRIIRWTEVFIIQNGDDSPKNQDPVDISKISENIAKATCDALLNYLDLLVTNNFQKIGIRTSLQLDNVSYCAGSNNTKLPPIYMKSLDNELIPVLHRITSTNLGENAIVLELIFRILNV